MKKLMDSFFQNVRFKYKLLLTFLCVYLLPMILLAGWLSIIFYNQLLASSLKDSENAGSTIATMISERITVMRDTLSAVASDKRTNDILKHMDNLASYAMSDQVRDKNDLLSYLAMMVSTSKIYRICLYMPNDYYFAHRNDIINTLDMAADTVWYGQYSKKPDDMYLQYNSRSREYQSYGIPASNDTPVISLIKPIYNPNNFHQTLALAEVEISHAEIKSMMQKVKSQFSIYILENGTSYFVDGTDVLNNTSVVIPDTIGEWKQLSVGREGVFYASQIDIDGTGLKLVIVVPTENMMQVILNQILIVILTILVSSIAVSLLAIYIATGISKRLDVLLKKVNRIRKGNFELEIVKTGRDEIGVLDENLNYMVESIKSLMEEQHRLGQEMKANEARIANAELLALQSQIDPHFLYNTLDLISWQSRFNNLQEMESLIKALSKFYKASLSKGSDLVDLAFELNHVESFIIIQNYRYNNAILLEIAVSPGIRCKLPKITLQPLVENAIIHGILCKPELVGRIFILAKSEEGCVHVSIHDDGVGMSRDKLEELNDHIGTNNGRIGIFNVYERLRINFGNKASLHFESAVDQGTTVTLIVPEST